MNNFEFPACPFVICLSKRIQIIHQQSTKQIRLRCQSKIPCVFPVWKKLEPNSLFSLCRGHPEISQRVWLKFLKIFLVELLGANKICFTVGEHKG